MQVRYSSFLVVKGESIIEQKNNEQGKLNTEGSSTYFIIHYSSFLASLPTKAGSLFLIPYSLFLAVKGESIMNRRITNEEH
jgi:hypothetical protein